MQQYPGPQAAIAGQAAPARQPKRNVVLILIGVVLLFISLGVGAVFAYNLWQYLTVADRWADKPGLIPEARDFAVRIIEQAAMRRMMIFGPISGFFGLIGLVLAGLGLRKK
jgi:hypothetical protein